MLRRLRARSRLLFLVVVRDFLVLLEHVVFWGVVGNLQRRPVSGVRDVLVLLEHVVLRRADGNLRQRRGLFAVLGTWPRAQAAGDNGGPARRDGGSL